MAEKTYNEKGQMVYVDENGNDVTQKTSVQNKKQSDKELKASQKQAKKEAKAKDIKDRDEYYKDVYGMSANEFFGRTSDAGVGLEPPMPIKGYVSYEDWKKNRNVPVGSSTGTNTEPIPAEVQEKIDTSNDATRQQKAQIKEGADEVRQYIKDNDLSDVAADAMKKYGYNTSLIDTNYTKGLPRSIWQAWSNNDFGPKGTKDAKHVRNYLLANELGTMLSNMGAGIKGGESKEGLWTSSVRKNMEEANNRNNEKFKADMNNQMQMLNIGGQGQIELNKRITDLMADKTMNMVAQHAGNIENTIGLWYLREAMGERWAKMSGDKQLAFLSAVNAIERGDVPSAQAIMLTTFGTKETADFARVMMKNQEKISNYDTNIKKSESDTAQAKAWLNVVDTSATTVRNIASAFGNIATGGLPGAIGNGLK